MVLANLVHGHDSGVNHVEQPALHRARRRLQQGAWKTKPRSQINRENNSNRAAPRRLQISALELSDTEQSSAGRRGERRGRGRNGMGIGVRGGV
jgi:hypothetical protein